MISEPDIPLIPTDPHGICGAYLPGAIMKQLSEPGWTPETAIADALNKHPNCTYADWDNGMQFIFTITVVVNLWRNEECYLAGDPPRHVIEGYVR